MDDLFKNEPAAPLAEALRPRTIAEVIGQSHLLGAGKPLNLVFQSGRPALDDPVGPAGRGQDHAGAPDRLTPSTANSSPCRPCCPA